MTLNAPDIKSFAEKYDPQPYHLARDAAEASLFGGLCASDWHMTALMMKLISDQLDAEKFCCSAPARFPGWSGTDPRLRGTTCPPA